ncbi:MAG: hypothetical protein JXK05_13965 [Campylobacterales bacterium]|nr:hypothetical protein [Campylobacterales bacterium]
MKHINTIGSASLGSVGVVVMSLLGGCATEQQEPQNRFLVIEQEPNGGYKVVEEMPTEDPNRAIIRERDAQGNVTERIMSEEEMKALAQQEYEKVQAGQSELNAPPSDAGMGLAGTILAVAAGSLLGNMIGNALMNNSNFKRNQDSVNRSAYHASKTGAAPAGSNTQKKSYFGDTKQSPSKTSPTTYGA